MWVSLSVCYDVCHRHLIEYPLTHLPDLSSLANHRASTSWSSTTKKHARNEASQKRPMPPELRFRRDWWRLARWKPRIITRLLIPTPRLKPEKRMARARVKPTEIYSRLLPRLIAYLELADDEIGLVHFACLSSFRILDVLYSAYSPQCCMRMNYNCHIDEEQLCFISFFSNIKASTSTNPNGFDSINEL